MSSVSLKLMDFNMDGGNSTSAMTQPLAFIPVKAEDECESCRALESELAALTERQAAEFSLRLEQLESRFQDQVEALYGDLNQYLKDGLAQCLTALFPTLANVSLRRGLDAEIRQGLMDSLPDSLSVNISPDIIEHTNVPQGVTVMRDPKLSGHTVEIRQGAARTRLAPEAILNSCLALLKSDNVGEMSK